MQPKQKNRGEVRVYEYSIQERDPLQDLLDSETGLSIFDPPQEIKTSQGKILICQASANNKPYGIIPGWILSSPKKTRDNQRKLIRVRPLTYEEQKAFRPTIRKRLQGNLLFW